MSGEIKKVIDGEIFDATYQLINGKKTLVIKAKTKEIINKDGSKSVVVRVPSLKMINKEINKFN